MNKRINPDPVRLAGEGLTLALYDNYVAGQKALKWRPDTREEWERSGRAGRERDHYEETGYMPGQYIGPEDDSTL